jgi:hypothetical protein
MLPSLKKAYLYFTACLTLLASKDKKVIDLTQKLQEKKDQQIKYQPARLNPDEEQKSDKKKDLNQRIHEKKIKQDLSQSLPNITEIEPADQLSEKREQKFLQEVSEKAGSWMHSFSHVRRDEHGFYILITDNPAGSKMRPGDQLSDYAMNMTPYWKVISVDGERINLEPINSNPFKSGVGAGGAKITKHDIDVYTGEHERKVIERINKSIEEGNVDIDRIKYILLGTVPTRFGPNGAEGGWYNATDTRSNRGGTKGLSSHDIMVADAKSIKEHGIPVPIKALNGTMDPSDWDSWISGNGTDAKYHPKNVDKYVDFYRQTTQKGKWRYQERDLQDMYRRYDPAKLEEHYEQMVMDVAKLSDEEWKEKYPYYEKNVQKTIELYERAKRGLEKNRNQMLEYLTEGETPELNSIMHNVFSKERRVSNRNVLQLIEMCKEDSSNVKYLHDIINLGGSQDYLTNEQIIKFFHLIDDIEGLKLASTKLKDSDNLRYALSYLYEQGESDFALSELVNHTGDLEVVNSLLGNISREYDDSELRKSTFGRNDKLLDFVKTNNIVQKIREAVTRGDVMSKHHAGELASRILSAFGPIMLWVPGDEEMVAELKKYR